MKETALVLGGGGAAGHAWLIGIIAGLADAGLDLSVAADLVIGTSAGATAAVQLRSGMTPAKLFASVTSEQAPPARQNHQRLAPLPIDEVFARMRSIGAAAATAIELQRGMGSFALESDAVLGPAAVENRRAMVAARLPGSDWPDRPMIVTAVNGHTGELTSFDRSSGVDLVDAVTASTAAPGLVPTCRIKGASYIDGGVRSVENADLASSFRNVLVFSPFGGRRQVEPGQFEGLRREAEWRTDLPSQVEYLRKQGSEVEVFTPDEDSQAAFGTNAMDMAARGPSARAGFAQGRREAEQRPLLSRMIQTPSRG